MEKKKFTLLLIALILELVSIGCAAKKGENETGAIAIVEIALNDLELAPADRSDEWFQWWVDRHKKIKNNIIPNQKIIFIGDSITQYWEEEGIETWDELNEKYNNKITNLGIGGDQIHHVIWRLRNGEFPQGINPEYIVLMIGTNNIGEGHDPESIASGIGVILQILIENAPSSKIILCSILPRDSGIYDVTTQRCNAVNAIIKNYNGFFNIRYIDMTWLYVDNYGNLKNELFTDKLHLSPEGYRVWGNKLLEIIW